MLIQTLLLRERGRLDCASSELTYKLVWHFLFVLYSFPSVGGGVILGLLSNFTSVQFSSVAQSCPTPCDPMNCSTPGLPVHHQLPEFTQTLVHRVGDVIQPSHPLSSPSPPDPNPSQHQGLFQWVNFSHEVAKVLEFQLQHQSFSEHPGLISFRMDWLDLLAVQGTLKSLLLCLQHCLVGFSVWMG